MAVFGTCPIWVLELSSTYLTDAAGWVLAFTTPGKALSYVEHRAGWSSRIIAPDQMLLLIADLHETGAAGLRLNPAANSPGVGRTIPLDSLAATYLAGHFA